MLTFTSSGLSIDNGFLSGLATQSEISRLLDEIFGGLDWTVFGEPIDFG